ncbi:MAG: magnesium transporter [Nitrospirae bacterium]|nr:magnesium transporter [Nitrospirota bacterium]
MAIVKFDQLIWTVRKFLHRGAIANLANMANRMHPADLARLFRNLDVKEKNTIFGLVKESKTKAQLISEMDEGSRRAVLETLPPYEIVQLLRHIPSDDVADIFADLTEEKGHEVLTLMGVKEYEAVKELLQYPAETAGGIMNTKVFSLPDDTSVQDAIKKIQEAGEVEMVFYVYVVDEIGKLVGVVSLRQLLLVPPFTKLRDIMEKEVIRVDTGVDQEEVARLVARYNILAVPVVDKEDRLIGIITVDDVIDVIREEATEDILKMAGTEDDEYIFTSSALRITRFRLPWLMGTLLGELIVGAVLWHFKATLEQVIALVSFAPIISAISGNVGVQSSTVVVRGLATGRVEVTNAMRIWLKDIRVALFIGTICGLLLGIIAYAWHGRPMLGLIVGNAMFVSITVASALGTLMPVLFKILKIDPAVSSGPVVTTLTDIVGFTIYLTVATIMLKFL